MSTITAVGTGTLIRMHTVAGDKLLTVNPTQNAELWAADLDRLSGPGEWAAAPPVDSDWERIDWETLAHRAGA